MTNLKQPALLHFDDFDLPNCKLVVRLRIMKAKEMHCFWNLFDKVLYMFRTKPLSIIRSTSALYTRIRYLSC